VQIALRLAQGTPRQASKRVHDPYLEVVGSRPLWLGKKEFTGGEAAGGLEIPRPLGSVSALRMLGEWLIESAPTPYLLHCSGLVPGFSLGAIAFTQAE
jgi:hypothetical protein